MIMATLSDDIPTTQPSTSLSRLHAANTNQSFFQQLNQYQLIFNVVQPIGSNSNLADKIFRLYLLTIQLSTINFQFQLQQLVGK
jgi:hypothetical protein